MLPPLQLRNVSTLGVEQAQAALSCVRTRLTHARALMAEARIALQTTYPTIRLPGTPQPPGIPAEPPIRFATLGRLMIERSHEIAPRRPMLIAAARADRTAAPVSASRRSASVAG